MGWGGNNDSNPSDNMGIDSSVADQSSVSAGMGQTSNDGDKGIGTVDFGLSPFGGMGPNTSMGMDMTDTTYGGNAGYGPDDVSVNQMPGFGLDDMSGKGKAPNQGIMGLIGKITGYKTNKTVTQNLIDMMVPGRNTPLGLMSIAMAPTFGLSNTVANAISLANSLAGYSANQNNSNVGYK